MLYVAGIPIDNDYTCICEEFAKFVRESDFVIGEERKNTLRLLAKCSAREKQFYLLNEHSTFSEITELTSHIKKADKVVLFSDAGTPCVADPGYGLVDLCYKEGVDVAAFPGPSSITSALSISGFYAEKFYFAGFLPKDKSKYPSFLKEIDLLKVTTVIFERPYGLKNIIEFLKLIQDTRRVAVLVNIGLSTSKNFRGHPKDIINELTNQHLKAPFVVVIEGEKHK